MATPVNERRLKDARLISNVALPNAANTVNGNSIDLGAATPFSVTEKLQVKISTVGGNGANNKNINVRLQDSADNGNWSNMAVFANPILQAVDNNGAGYANSSVTIALPPTTRRYIRSVALGEANGGNAANGYMLTELLF